MIRRAFANCILLLFLNVSCRAGVVEPLVKDIWANVEPYRSSVTRHFLNETRYGTDTSGIQVDGIAFLRTHQHAAKTLAGILFRFAQRRRLRIFTGQHFLVRRHETALPEITESMRERHKLVFQAIVNQGFDSHKNMLDDILQWYHQMIREPRILTMVQEPVRNYVERFFYYVVPVKIRELLQGDAEASMPSRDTLFNWLRERIQLDVQRRKCDPQLRDVGLPRGAGELAAELLSSEDKLTTVFDIIFVAERFDESLVVMRHQFNWDMRDLSYTDQYDPHDARSPEVGVRVNSYDDGDTQLARLRVQNPPPSIESIPDDIVDRIHNMTQSDRRLWQLSNTLLDRRLARLRDAGFDIEAELRDLDAQNRLLSNACRKARDERDDKQRHVQLLYEQLTTVCNWYELCDACLELVARHRIPPVW